MTTANKNCPCPSPEIIQVPGVEGDPGTNGTNGNNAYTVTTSNFTIPAIGGSVTLTVANSDWMAIGQTIIAGAASGVMTGTVTAKPASTSVTVTWQNASGDSAAGTSVLSGAVVSPGGKTVKITGVSQFTDNTTGAASSTLAAGVGVSIIPIFVNLAQITATTICSFTPGYAFKVLGIQFSAEIAVTTAAKAATITPAVNGSSVTGGALALTSANCTPKGTTVSGSAITAANTGTSAQTLSLVASSVTTFSEGTGWILLKVQNMDQANAEASIASKLNSILTALS